MVPGEESILSNLRRGALEYCVLALLQRDTRYGLDIARTLTADGVLMNGEGTLYPLLARLRKSGLVSTSWQESTAGPPRRYYALTEDGGRALAAFRRTWRPFRDAVDTALAAPTPAPPTEGTTPRTEGTNR
ncbi:MAG: PadR family transcriptional regulator [Georgenia sp.]